MSNLVLTPVFVLKPQRDTVCLLFWEPTAHAVWSWILANHVSENEDRVEELMIFVKPYCHDRLEIKDPGSQWHTEEVLGSGRTLDI